MFKNQLNSEGKRDGYWEYYYSNGKLNSKVTMLIVREMVIGKSIIPMVNYGIKVSMLMMTEMVIGKTIMKMVNYLIKVILLMVKNLKILYRIH